MTEAEKIARSTQFIIDNRDELQSIQNLIAKYVETDDDSILDEADDRLRVVAEAFLKISDENNDINEIKKVPNNIGTPSFIIDSGILSYFTHVIGITSNLRMAKFKIKLATLSLLMQGVSQEDVDELVSYGKKADIQGYRDCCKRIGEKYGINVGNTDDIGIGLENVLCKNQEPVEGQRCDVDLDDSGPKRD